MPLMAMAIDLACSSSYPNHQDACVHALEAYTKQTQIYQTTDKTENYITTKVQNEAGQQITYTITAAGFVYKSYKNKSVNIKLPTLGMCDSVNTNLSPSSYVLTFKWNVW
jgi:hypothetical protein